MKRYGVNGVQIGLATVTAAGLLFIMASTGQGQPALSGACFEPSSAAQIVIAEFSASEPPSDQKLCEKACNRGLKWCTNAAKSNDKCLKKYVKDGSKVVDITDCQVLPTKDERKACEDSYDELFAQANTSRKADSKDAKDQCEQFFKVSCPEACATPAP